MIYNKPRNIYFLQLKKSLIQLYIFQNSPNLKGRISENNEKRSDEEQRQIDQQRIARNILEMANNLPKQDMMEEVKKEENNNTNNLTNAQTTVQDDLNNHVNGFMPE